MYFILEIIIFIARLFSDRQPEAIYQEQSEQEKKPDDAKTNHLGSAKVPEVIILFTIAVADMVACGKVNNQASSTPNNSERHYRQS